jgi:hypothetical protein
MDVRDLDPTLGVERAKGYILTTSSNVTGSFLATYLGIAAGTTKYDSKTRYRATGL